MQQFSEQTSRISYSPNFNDYKEKNFEEEDENMEGSDEEIQGWDVFRIFPSKLKTGSKADTTFFDVTARITKLLTYFVLFALILGGGIVAKMSIIFAVAQINNDAPVDYCDFNDVVGKPSGRNLSATVASNYHIEWYWCIVLGFASSEILGLVNAVYLCLFKKRVTPRTVDIFILLVIESLHTVGLALLVFLVLPELNSIQAVAVSSSTCLVPGFLAVLFRNRQHYPRSKSIFLFVGDIVALLSQLCGILIWLFPDTRVKMTTHSRYTLPVALVLVSCRWWGNNLSAHSTFALARFLFRVKKRLENGKGFTHGFSAICRISIFSLATILIAHLKGIEIPNLFSWSVLIGRSNVTLTDISPATPSAEENQVFSNLPRTAAQGYITIDSYHYPLVILVLHAASSFITYSSSKFAYRTMMQSYGFALPINLVVPGTIATITAISAMRAKYTCALHHFFPDYLFFDVPDNIGNVADFLNHWYPWIWLISLSSQAWITMHIWLPHIERLAPTAHIFLVPTYDSLIIDQSIVLNRRIDDIFDGIPAAEWIEGLEESDTTYSSLSVKSGSSEIEENDRVTRILVCATMWHETEDEMMEFVGSILRLDTDQATKRFTQGYYNLRMQDYYELETHVFFDDAFRCMHGCEGSCEHDENETQVNDYAMSLIKTMEKSIDKFPVVSKPPKKYPCPYGGRLEWSLPGKTRMIVHLKDKNKIRHRKRWSQVMYMYYLLGHLFMDTPISPDRKKIIAENTFLLTLDGDIDFQPSAVKVLVDLMKRDKDVGAACGRIHPVGTGPMIWFQKFEYAISHWLLKSTEHAIGSVLCSPGAFSLFRAKALMEHNVMRKYATQSTEPLHYVQYDQGEDRWLCTLILQAGYRIEYSAVSDSYTHAPETFNEFYNQRRRWIPSTIANIYDLLSTSQETRRINDDISWLYVVYQWILMGSTVLGPGTIFLMLVGAFVAAFRIDNWSSFGYNLIPIAIFVIVCTFCKARVQLIVAGMITALYGLVMIVVLVGIMLQIAEDGWAAPSTILFFVVAGQLVVAGLIHPQEWSCLLCGLIYYITVPSMYMVLIIFALFNVNNVTWGTRDSKSAVPLLFPIALLYCICTRAKKNCGKHRPIEATMFLLSLSWLEEPPVTQKNCLQLSDWCASQCMAKRSPNRVSCPRPRLLSLRDRRSHTPTAQPLVSQENEKNDVSDHGRSVKSRINNEFRTNTGQNRGSIEFSLAGLFRCILCTQNGISEEDRNFEAIKNSLDQITSRLDAMERNSYDNETQKNRRGELISRSNGSGAPQPMNPKGAASNSDNYRDEYNGEEQEEDDEDLSETATDIYGEGSSRGGADFLVSPCWIQDENLRKGGVEFLSSEEEIFWEGLIEKYLHPIEEDKKIIEKTAEGLKNLRDGNVFKFFMINALFVLIVFLMQQNKEILHLEWPLGKKYNISYSQYTNEVSIYKNYLELEPIGCLFILGFVLILAVQFIAMLFHRFQTFSHILANTSIEWPCCKKPFDPTDEEDLEKHADDIADGLQKVVENTGGSILTKRNSTIAPGKRTTVLELLDSPEKKVKLSTSLDTLFRRNLNDSNSEMSRFMSTRMPPDIVEALERRHSSMVSHQRNSRAHNIHKDTYGKNVSGKKSLNNSISGANGYSYDNKAFVPESEDYDENNIGSGIDLPHRPSQVTFQ